MIRPFALTLALLLAGPAAAGPCRLALALGLDVSGSVDAAEYRLQIDGLAAALEAPQVVAALIAPGAAPVRLMAYDWSGPADQRVVADWREIADRAALTAFTAELRAATRPQASPATALGAALATGARFLAAQPECWRRVLDISGDGPSNTGPRPQSLGPLDALAGGTITVNALAILPGPASPALALGPGSAAPNTLAPDPGPAAPAPAIRPGSPAPGAGSIAPGGSSAPGAGSTSPSAGSLSPGSSSASPAEAAALIRYFETAIIRGPGAFVEPAAGYADFARAMQRKLLRELKGLVVGDAGRAHPPGPPVPLPRRHAGQDAAAGPDDR